MNTKKDPGTFTGKAVQEAGITSACFFWSVFICITPLGGKQVFFQFWGCQHFQAEYKNLNIQIYIQALEEIFYTSGALTIFSGTTWSS